MPEDTNQAPQQNDAPAQTENQTQAPNTEISALANYRAQKAAQASSATPQTNEVGAQPQANVGQNTSEQPREPYIPRERFDEVIQQRNQLQQQINQFQQQQYPQQPQQVVGPTGMVQPQQAPPQQAVQQQAVQTFLDQVTKDPTSRQQWQKRISNEGVTALADFVKQAVESVGRPLLAEYTKHVSDQLSPIQRQYVNNQVNSYAQTRQSDPEFAVAKPAFDQLVNTAVQRGYDVTNPQVLSTLEFLAKQQSQQYAPQQFQNPPTPTPFSERPGNSGQTLNKPAQANLTPQQQAMAKRFGMTNEQYADSLRAMGVKQ